MTEEELQKIKEHIEMRARIEPYATEIIRILWKAVEELETAKELQEKYDEQEKILSQTTGYGRDKIKNLMDLYNSSLAQKSKRIAELEKQIEKMKMCCNCNKWRNWKEELDDISYPCSKHNATDKCSLWVLKE